MAHLTEEVLLPFSSSPPVNFFPPSASRRLHVSFISWRETLVQQKKKKNMFCGGGETAMCKYAQRKVCQVAFTEVVWTESLKWVNVWSPSETALSGRAGRIHLNINSIQSWRTYNMTLFFTNKVRLSFFSRLWFSVVPIKVEWLIEISGMEGSFCFLVDTALLLPCWICFFNYFFIIINISVIIILLLVS